MTATEILYRDIRDEIPTNFMVPAEPVRVGDKEGRNYTECVVEGEVINPGISLKPIPKGVGFIEASSETIDKDSNYVGPGVHIAGYLMDRLVYSKRVQDGNEEAEELREAANSEAREVIMSGVACLLESRSIEKAVERVAVIETSDSTNAWLGLSKSNI